MKTEHISDALNFLNDDIIEETDKAREIHSTTNLTTQRSPRVWWKWAAIAASLILVAYTGIRVFPTINTLPEENISDSEATNSETGLPLLPAFEDTGDGMSFEGYLAYDISDLVSGNPWTEDAGFTTLPVYRNPITYNEHHIASGADFDKMRERLIEIAVRMGLNPDTLTITDDAPDEELQKKTTEKMNGQVPEGYFNPTCVMTEADGVKIDVNQRLEATIHFEPARSLPAKYHFADYAPYEDVLKVAEYLKEEYKDLIAMKDPQTNISGGDYNIYLQQNYNIRFFNSDNDPKKQFLNYIFDRISFSCNDEGKLFLARVWQPDLSQKVGDYPIITPTEAAELLSARNYISSVPDEIAKAESAAKIELIYRTGSYDQYYMPYYRFLVELPDRDLSHIKEEHDGLKSYGAYYIPAIRSDHLLDMPTWDGSFN